MERPEVVGTEEGQGGESSVLGKQFWREHGHWNLSHPSLPLSIHLPFSPPSDNFCSSAFWNKTLCILLFRNASVQFEQSIKFWPLSCTFFHPLCFTLHFVTNLSDNSSAQLLVKWKIHQCALVCISMHYASTSTLQIDASQRNSIQCNFANLILQNATHGSAPQSMAIKHPTNL